ncbi:serine/threonine-protein kinase 11-interacting protein-like isoform X2 [Amphiura filiformis]|uniref:serine/threonine-protein kinase 11-interacting protein-like isoform X2 n=1 Tax=Amphiura filiformis TaxID=82378 RepID=UPI003B222696
MSGYQRMNQPSVDAVGELATFLRKHGSQIQDKTNKFSLSSASLVYLNKCFHHLIQHQATSKSAGAPHTKREQDVAYLLDFFKRAHAVKLVHSTVTLQGAVDISHFHALTFLEIKRVPVHLLVGLKDLRRQLEVLICSRSLTSISSLLQSCGGDMTSSAPWPALHTVNLSHNHIDKLDDSLKLLPSVKVLDLSHNDIKHGRNYLEDLSEIVHLNLSFNRMETMPALGLVARTNLKSLSLKHNNLESLAGLEDFSTLEVLDVATNCIFDKMELRMLGYLHNIKAVYLHGNPLAFDPGYRLQVVRKLPYQACRNKTQIDGIPLTPSEAELVSPERFTPSPVPRRPPSKELVNPLEASLNADISSLEESIDLSSTKRLMHKEKKSRGKRNQRKVKHAAIADPTKEYLDSNTSLTTSDSDIEGTKQKMERMRKNHGSDWLLALQDPYSTPAINTREPSEQQDSTSQDPSGSDTELLTEVEVHQSDDVQQQNAKTEEPVVKEMVVIAQVEKPLEEKVADSNPPAAKTIDSKTNIYQVKSTESEEIVIYGTQEDKSADEAQELLSPLLVTVYQNNNETKQIQLFVTVRSTHIEEKDIHGQVTEELDLVSLKGMKKSQDTLRDSDSQFLIVPVVDLTFDYIRRDRQKRRYFMENEESCLALFNVLEPFVEKNQLEERQKGMIQCLKCSTEFHKHAAKRKVHKTPRKSVIQNAVGSHDNSSSDIESMNELLVCPECNSSMLVDLEHPQQTKAYNSNTSTPMGSVSSLEMNGGKPLATSSPWKVGEDDTRVSSSSTDYHSAEDSPSTSQPSYQTAKSGTSTTNGTLNGDSQASSNTDRTLAGSNSEQSTSHSKKSLLGEFNLPDATMRMSMGDSVGDEISPYPPEKMAQMLYTGVKGFDQKYTLVPPDLLSGNSSNEASKPTTPVSKNLEENNPKRRIITVDSNEGNQQASNSVISNERLLSGKPPQFPVHSNVDLPVRHLSDGGRTRKVSGTGSEDDIEILEKQSAHQNIVSDDSQKNWLQSRTHNDARRLDSNDSDIAVIADQIDTVKPDSTTSASDTVFDVGHDHMHTTNLASALSDDASRMQPLSPVAELNSNVSGLDTSSGGSDNDVHIHATFPQSSHTETSEQHKNGDSPMEHSSTESQLSDSIYKRRKSSQLESTDVDFSEVDHRLKLYFDMDLFGDEEEFKCTIKANIYQLSKAVSFKGYLLVSTHNLYILKITKEESDSPSDWLTKRTQHPIRDLLYIHIGLGSQSFQLEFNNDGILYTVAVRDKQWCEKFVSQISDAVHNSPINKRKYKGIVRDHPNTQANLMCQVYGALMSENSPAEVDTNLSLYILGYRKVIKEMKKSMSLQLEPIGIAVTAADIYLVEDNHYWPLQQAKVSRGSTKGQQFKHCDQHAITDIQGLELYEDAQCDVTINFNSEDTGEESQWHIQTESASTLAAFMSALQLPWQQLFGVAMPQITHPTITIQDEF